MLRAHADDHVLAEPTRIDPRRAQRDAPTIGHDQVQAVVRVQTPLQHVHRRAAEETGDEQIGRTVVQRHRAVDLLDHAILEHHDALAKRHRFDLIVGDVDHGGAKLAVQLRNLGAHAVAQLGVQVGQRFVEQEHRGFTHHRPAQRHALTLTAGHRLGQLVQHRGQAQQLCGVVDALGDDLLRMPTQLEPERQVLGHGHVRIQRVALEHHGDVAILWRHVVDHALADLQRAGADVFKTGDHAQQGRFAAAGRSHQHHQFAIGHFETRALHRHLAIVVDLADTFQLHFRHRSAST